MLSDTFSGRYTSDQADIGLEVLSCSSYILDSHSHFTINLMISESALIWNYSFCQITPFSNTKQAPSPASRDLRFFFSPEYFDDSKLVRV